MMLRRFGYLIAGAGLIALVVIYSVLDPNEVYFPKCPVKWAFGVDCPGCGSQRAVHALLNGDIVAAWGFNALLVASIPLLVLLTFAEFNRTRYPRLWHFLNSRGFIVAVLTVILIWAVGRNLVPLI